MKEDKLKIKLAASPSTHHQLPMLKPNDQPVTVTVADP